MASEGEMYSCAFAVVDAWGPEEGWVVGLDVAIIFSGSFGCFCGLTGRDRPCSFGVCVCLQDVSGSVAVMRTCGPGQGFRCGLAGALKLLVTRWRSWEFF